MVEYKDIREFMERRWRFIVLLLAVILLVLGIVLVSNYHQLTETTFVHDYTDCKLVANQERCLDVLDDPELCVCFGEFNLTSDLQGTVTAYYQLDDFNQNDPSYAKSRDNKQMAGNLALEPSADCGDFRFDNTSGSTKPIAPCGAVADSMLADYITLRLSSGHDVDVILHGLISEDDKKGFKNPPGNLTEAFSKFAKPKSWDKHIYELDTSNESNNGFQNEQFIAWMRTDWKLKPAWRVNHTAAGFEKGLPKDVYGVFVEYRNTPNNYRGRRKLVFKAVLSVYNNIKLGIGIFFILAGLGIGCFVAFIFVVSKLQPSAVVSEENNLVVSKLQPSAVVSEENNLVVSKLQPSAVVSEENNLVVSKLQPSAVVSEENNLVLSIL